MAQTLMTQTLEEWIAGEAIPFALDARESVDTAIDNILAALGDSVEVLGFGEALHGGEELLILRNRLFQRLVEKHGFSAIAIESSFPRGRLVNDYVLGRGPVSYDAVQEAGFSHGFGAPTANRALVEWMRQYNTDPAHSVQLHFYGFDSPTEMMSSDSPRQLLHFVLDYLAGMDSAGAAPYRQRIDALLGEDAAWENPAAMLDAAQSIGLAPAASALRIETEDLIAELGRRRPEWVAKSDRSRYLEAIHQAVAARQLLTYHAEVARTADNRTLRLLGLRDATMADNLAAIALREPGKVLAFAHNSHLRRGEARWQWGNDLLVWWPAGAHLEALMGPRYAVIGSAVGVSADNGIGQPETGALEQWLSTAPGAACLIPTHKGQALLPAALAALPTRSGSTKNSSYFPLTAESLSDFDALAFVASVTYSRGGPPLP